jgi:DNA-directed RNA polymerase subunit RPC12/RpoP
MNEVKYQCINCARFHSYSLDLDKIIKPGDTIQCQWCKNEMVIGEITYFLHVHEPDPE